MADLGAWRDCATGNCEFRGHDMKWAPPDHGEAGSLQQASCRNCPAWVRINTRPAPDETEISGPAVALDCPADCEPRGNYTQDREPPGEVGGNNTEGKMFNHEIATLLDRYGSQLNGLLKVQAGFVDLLDSQRAELESLRDRVAELERRSDHDASDGQ